MDNKNEYKDLFFSALEFTKALGLNPSNPARYSALSQKEVTLEELERIKNTLRFFCEKNEISPKDNCIKINLLLKEIVEDIIQIPLLFVTGNYYIYDPYSLEFINQYSFDQQSAKSHLENNPEPNSKMKFHCWLSTYQHFIIDLTIKADLDLDILFCAGTMPNLRYIPIVIGEEYIDKIGGVKHA